MTTVTGFPAEENSLNLGEGSNVVCNDTFDLESNAQSELSTRSSLQLQRMLEIIVHGSQCLIPNCEYPDCRTMKTIFRHGIRCITRFAGGCPLCMKMWYLLRLHAGSCNKESGCRVPRCRDLKDYIATRVDTQGNPNETPEESSSVLMTSTAQMDADDATDIQSSLSQSLED